jgi:hypothetical protein
MGKSSKAKTPPAQPLALDDCGQAYTLAHCFIARSMYILLPQLVGTYINKEELPRTFS